MSLPKHSRPGDVPPLPPGPDRAAFHRQVARNLARDIALGLVRDLDAGMPETEALAIADRRRAAFALLLEAEVRDELVVARWTA